MLHLLRCYCFQCCICSSHEISPTILQSLKAPHLLVLLDVRPQGCFSVTLVKCVPNLLIHQKQSTTRQPNAVVYCAVCICMCCSVATTMFINIHPQTECQLCPLNCSFTVYCLTAFSCFCIRLCLSSGVRRFLR